MVFVLKGKSLRITSSQCIWCMSPSFTDNKILPIFVWKLCKLFPLPRKTKLYSCKHHKIVSPFTHVFINQCLVKYDRCPICAMCITAKPPVIMSNSIQSEISLSNPKLDDRYNKIFSHISIDFIKQDLYVKSRCIRYHSTSKTVHGVLKKNDTKRVLFQKALCLQRHHL